MKKVLVVQPLIQDALALFDARDDISYEMITDFSEANLLARIVDADAMTIRDAPLPRSVIAAAPRLKVVSRHGVGYDNIPVDDCTARNIPVTVVGSVNTVSVAEQTMFLLLAAARVGIELDAAVRSGIFAVRGRVTGVELKGRRILIVGFGRIGREVGSRCHAFGMHVSFCDPIVTGSPGLEFEAVASLAAGLRSADVVSLHIPLSPETRHVIGANELALLPKDAIVINASRGGLLDEAALIRAIQSGHLHGAGLDTFEAEPLPAGSPLLAEKRIVLSPHSAALTTESLKAMGIATVKNALAGLDGNLNPELVVNRSVLKGAHHAAE